MRDLRSRPRRWIFAPVTGAIRSAVTSASEAPTPPLHHVVYLTGAPAAGKSTLSRAMGDRVPSLAIFEYGARLTAHLAAKPAPDVTRQDQSATVAATTPRPAQEVLTQRTLRAHSARIASPADIVAVDAELLAFVARERTQRPVLIDTHAVTKEQYGFRITPFSLQRIRDLAPTLIVDLFTPPDVAVARISSDPDGRPQITAFEAEFHTYLQASVAVSYATCLGIPVYLLDSSRPAVDLVEELVRRLGTAPAGAEDYASPAVLPPA